jgi:ABC-type nitrate/sulfonate/bicarbonate transport system substrate-binding protein
MPGKLALLAAALATLAATLAGCGADPAAGPAKVRVAFDWTPNTNHTGLYVAQKLGYYAEAGIEVEVVPYNSTGPETVLTSGNADFGYSESLISARAAGQNLKAVYAVESKPVTAIAYPADSTTITRPADLDGKIFAGFGIPSINAQVKQVIQQDGGKGEFEEVLLSTSAYDAVRNGQADFTHVYLTWEGIEADLLGKPFAYIDPADYGVPLFYPLVIASTDEYLAANPEVAKSFVQATQRGYEYAADHPGESAEILLAANPEVLRDAELVNESQAKLSAEFYRDTQGRAGYSDPKIWADYSQWFFDSGLLTDANGNPLPAPLPAEDLYSNEYLG